MYTLNCKGKLLPVSPALVMGILNVTPDSFFAGSRQEGRQQLLTTAGQMLSEGASILDIGGQSTRPGAVQISADEEASRILPAVEAVQFEFPGTIISIDTYHASVARVAVDAGAAIVNDISGGLADDMMLHTVAALKVPFICMHMQGSPGNMPKQPRYTNFMQDLLDFFIERMDSCRQAGIHDLVIDPGFGFGKTYDQNFKLIRQLQMFRILQLPLLLGVSRKSTIYKTLDVSAEEALNGTTVLNTAGLLNGANILRVHDVKAAVEAVKLVERIRAQDFPVA